MPLLTDERYVQLMEKATSAFLPYHPIELVELFKGRTHVVRRLVNEVHAPGRHAVLYGDRGVGKSSLANLLSFFSKWKDDDVFFFRCAQDTNFDILWATVLQRIGFTHIELRRSENKSSKLKLSQSGFGLEIGEDENVELESIVSNCALSPQAICEKIENKELLIIVDEYDRISDTTTSVAMADVIKHLSDARSKTKLVIVGVAESVNDLIGNHPSISRALAEVKLDRMTDSELLEILTGGFESVGIDCQKTALESMAQMSDGFPHFTHLLGLKCCEAVLNRAIDSNVSHLSVRQDDLETALKDAVEGSQESLRASYEQATLTVRKKSDSYVRLLEALALSDETAVQINSILDNINKLFGLSLKQQNISSGLGELVKKRKVLKRPRTGYYSFCDPMMRAYVRMRMGMKSLRGGDRFQMELPFMASEF